MAFHARYSPLLLPSGSSFSFSAVWKDKSLRKRRVERGGGGVKVQKRRESRVKVILTQLSAVGYFRD